MKNIHSTSSHTFLVKLLAISAFIWLLPISLVGMNNAAFFAPDDSIELSSYVPKGKALCAIIFTSPSDCYACLSLFRSVEKILEEYSIPTLYLLSTKLQERADLFKETYKLQLPVFPDKYSIRNTFIQTSTPFVIFVNRRNHISEPFVLKQKSSLQEVRKKCEKIIVTHRITEQVVSSEESTRNVFKIDTINLWSNNGKAVFLLSSYTGYLPSLNTIIKYDVRAKNIRLFGLDGKETANLQLAGSKIDSLLGPYSFTVVRENPSLNHSITLLLNNALSSSSNSYLVNINLKDRTTNLITLENDTLPYTHNLLGRFYFNQKQKYYYIPSSTFFGPAHMHVKKYSVVRVYDNSGNHICNFGEFSGDCQEMDVPSPNSSAVMTLLHDGKIVLGGQYCDTLIVYGNDFHELTRIGLNRLKTASIDKDQTSELSSKPVNSIINWSISTYRDSILAVCYQKHIDQHSSASEVSFYDTQGNIYRENISLPSTVSFILDDKFYVVDPNSEGERILVYTLLR